LRKCQNVVCPFIPLEVMGTGAEALAPLLLQPAN